MYDHNISDSNIVFGTNSEPGICYKIVASEEQGNLQFSQSNTACVYLKPTIFIPNVFSPNADGRNDLFLPLGIGIKSFVMEIYNRWGELVYLGSEKDQGWDGTLTTHVPAPVGVYVFVIHATGIISEQEQKYKAFDLKGPLTLVR